MTIEEKRKKLQEFCDELECCDYCRLLDFSIDCEFERFTDDCVCEAFKIAFGGEERGCCEDCKHCDKSMECYPCKECKNNYGIKNCFEPIYSNDKVPTDTVIVESELNKLREENKKLKEIVKELNHELNCSLAETDYVRLFNERNKSIVKKLKNENSELKRLLRLAIDDLNMTKSHIISYYCDVDNCDDCLYTPTLLGCKWKHYSDAMKLIGGNENE